MPRPRRLTPTLRSVGAALSLSCALAIGAGALAAPPAFSEVNASVGVSAVHDDDLPVTMGPSPYLNLSGSATVGDFNNDGWMDFFFVGGGDQPDRLYINDGAGAFTDQAAAWGIAALHRGVAACTGDYNNDGRLDIFLTSFGPVGAGTTAQPGMNRLYRNNGNGTFTNVGVAAGVNVADPSAASGTGAAFGDYDLDGDLDLMVCTWWKYFPPFVSTQGNKLFRNNGDGTFTNVTAAAGVSMTTVHGFGPIWADMNGDRYPELLIAGDFETSRYFINDGDGTFTDFTAGAGVNSEPNAMGQCVGDFDRDGRFDWYVTSKPPSSLYMNQGGHVFSEVGAAAGVDYGGWGWGAFAADLDHDGWTDIVAVNGWDPPDWENHPKYAFMNNGDGTFTDVAQDAGFTHTGQARGLVRLDMDNDGDQDFIIACNREPVAVIRNDLDQSLGDARWLRVFLLPGDNARIAPNGVGSRVVLTLGGVERHSFIGAGVGYLGTHELSAHFGLGSEPTATSLRIEWASGQVTTLTNVAADQTLTITAPRAVDINADGVVNTADLGLVLGAFGSGGPAADINNDGVVNTADLGLLIAAFGT